eukprot:1939201-Rhodomonas_salina.3
MPLHSLTKTCVNTEDPAPPTFCDTATSAPAPGAQTQRQVPEHREANGKITCEDANKITCEDADL